MRHAAGWGDAPLRPEQGLRLGGRYELRSRIAVGGMGEVWLSRDLSLDRSVATKVLREDLAGDGRFLARLRAEARTSAPLTHPNIAALYDYGEQCGSGYLVMELVPGETLSDLLAREKALAPETLLPILAQAARALHAAHVCGVVHRDVKPSNILLTPEGEVKITDFGISLTTSAREDSEGTVMGTAQYLSPEQAMGRPATPASDVYGLGVVAYEALAGRRPFTGPSLVDIAYAHVHEPVPALPADLPEQVRALVMRMLDKHPERRPRSAASLARTLDRIAAELELARPFDVEPAPRLPAGTAAAEPDATTEAFDVASAWGDESRAPAPPAVPARPETEPDAETELLDEDELDDEDDVEPQWLPTLAGPVVPSRRGRTHAARPSHGAHAAPRSRHRAGRRRPGDVRPGSRRRRAGRGRLWFTVLVAVAITAMVALAAGTLTETGGSGAAGGAPAADPAGATGATALLDGDSGAGLTGPDRVTLSEVGWW